jgi:DNA-binding MarR family transcriptional regulator
MKPDKRGHHRKTERARNADRIRAIFKKNPYARPQDIIKETGLHPATVSKHLKVLREQAQQGEEAGK